MLDFSSVTSIPSPAHLSPPWSWAGHIPFAWWLIQQTRPNTIVELGTHKGHSYFSFCQAVIHSKTVSRCYAIDTWKGDHQSGFYGEEVYNSVSLYNQEHYSDFSTLLRTTFDEALDHFADHTIDILHIDGLHTYEAVKHDYSTWSRKLSPKGIILFHDISVHHSDFGVWKLWEELRQRFPALSFSHSYGLGVLIAGEKPDQAVVELHDAWHVHHQKHLIRALFSEAGKRIEFQAHSTINQQTINVLNRSEQHHKAQISRSFKKISELNSSNNQLSAYNTILENKKRTLSKLLRQKNTHIETLKNRITALESTITEQRERLSQQEQELNTIKSTYSWKITKPARKFPKSLRKRTKKIKQHLMSLRITQQLLTSPITLVDYERWIREHETPSKKQMRAIRSSIDKMKNPPLISVVMPVYNPPVAFLNEALNSVKAQTYPHWELCIADDCSPNQEVRDIIKKHANEDQRIKYVFRKENGHISAASNSALKLVTGSFIALLDHDDLLHPLALYWNAKEIIKHPDVALIYSDEDKINETGCRSGPYFKSDFNYDLFLCQNTISHLGVYKTSIIKTIGGFRQGIEGSQDYDLALRTIEQITSEQIRHIPRILYHWRIHTNSTAASIDAKPYARIAAIKAVADHLRRRKIDAAVTGAPHAPVFNRIIYTLPDPAPSVDIILLDNVKQHTERCLRSILTKTTYSNYSITLLTKNPEHYLNHFIPHHTASDITIRTLFQEKECNYSRCNNRAAAASRAEYLCFFSNHIEVLSPDWLEEMVGHAVQKEIGAAGIKTICSEKNIFHGGIIMGINGIAGYPHKNIPNGTTGYIGRGCLQQAFSALAGGCLVINRNKYEQVGGMNNERLNADCAQINLCLKLTSKGFRNVWTPHAELLTHQTSHSGSENKPPNHPAWTNKEIRYMKQTWKQYISHDPAYNPNLSIDHEDFSHARPPRIKH